MVGKSNKKTKKDNSTVIKQWMPKGNPILYYYCSADSFMSIIKNKTLRFSDLYHMNDLSELQQGNIIFDEIIKNSSAFSEETKAKFTLTLQEFKNRCVLLSISFSRAKDSLSQWRGYGDDAKGFCIGYRVKDFCKLPVHLLKIEYEFKKQYTLLIDTMYSIEKEIADGINETNAHLICELLEVFSMMKNDTFREERECRLIHPIFVDIENKGKLFDVFKDDPAYGCILKDIDFRLVRNTPTPFIDMDFTQGNTVMPIKEVIIGPRNQSSILDIELFLRTNGIYGARVSESLSSYR